MDVRQMYDHSNSLYPSASVLKLVQISQHCATWFTCKRYRIDFHSLALTAWNSGQTNGLCCQDFTYCTQPFFQGSAFLHDAIWHIFITSYSVQTCNRAFVQSITANINHILPHHLKRQNYSETYMLTCDM